MPELKTELFRAIKEKYPKLDRDYQLEIYRELEGTDWTDADIRLSYQKIFY